MKPVVLIVDDEKHTRDGLRQALGEKYDVYVADSVEAAKNVLEGETVDVLITDLKMQSGDSGLLLIDRALTLNPAPVCLMMTAYGSVEVAVEAMKRGAYDYLTKPVDLDRLEILIVRALRSRKVETEVTALRKQVEKKFGMQNIIGSTPAMEQVFEVIQQVAPSRATVLIEGESGTGKELIAQALHMLSPRKNHPFVIVHCAALSGNLLQSELFGHEKGAFTGATERRLGRFEYANHGTIFLDEIGEIDAQTQVTLLRVLQDRIFQRVGSNKDTQVDVRVVAATNKDLEVLVSEGKFREDLFFRLNVVRIVMPPLRDRVADIPLLANSFLKEFSKENAKTLTQISPEVLQVLQEYPWKGNVRELRSAIEHATVLAKTDKLLVKDLPPGIRDYTPRSNSKTGSVLQAGMTMDQIEKRAILQALKENDGNRTDAAKKLGISRRTLHRKIKEYQLEAM
ncbi:MAG: sigma-54 dependent transcriptional regulator [Verrucomicrobiota bacterium]|nr:sigma-54 dependent transcriptional regulator [Verrucomicrobiota bacterium]